LREPQHCRRVAAAVSSIMLRLRNAFDAFVVVVVVVIVVVIATAVVAAAAAVAVVVSGVPFWRFRVERGPAVLFAAAGVDPMRRRAQSAAASA